MKYILLVCFNVRILRTHHERLSPWTINSTQVFQMLEQHCRESTCSFNLVSAWVNEDDDFVIKANDSPFACFHIRVRIMVIMLNNKLFNQTLHDDPMSWV